jgi:hypothetical protein
MVKKILAFENKSALASIGFSVFKPQSWLSTREQALATEASQTMLGSLAHNPLTRIAGRSIAALLGLSNLIAANLTDTILFLTNRLQAAGAEDDLKLALMARYLRDLKTNLDAIQKGLLPKELAQRTDLDLKQNQALAVKLLLQQSYASLFAHTPDSINNKYQAEIVFLDGLQKEENLSLNQLKDFAIKHARTVTHLQNLFQVSSLQELEELLAKDSAARQMFNKSINELKQSTITEARVFKACFKELRKFMHSLLRRPDLSLADLSLKIEEEMQANLELLAINTQIFQAWQMFAPVQARLATWAMMVPQGIWAAIKETTGFATSLWASQKGSEMGATAGILAISSLPGSTYGRAKIQMAALMQATCSLVGSGLGAKLVEPIHDGACSLVAQGYGVLNQMSPEACFVFFAGSSMLGGMEPGTAMSIGLVACAPQVGASAEGQSETSAPPLIDPLAAGLAANSTQSDQALGIHSQDLDQIPDLLRPIFPTLPFGVLPNFPTELLNLIRAMPSSTIAPTSTPTPKADDLAFETTMPPINVGPQTPTPPLKLMTATPQHMPPLSLMPTPVPWPPSSVGPPMKTTLQVLPTAFTSSNTITDSSPTQERSFTKSTTISLTTTSTPTDSQLFTEKNCTEGTWPFTLCRFPHMPEYGFSPILSTDTPYAITLTAIRQNSGMAEFSTPKEQLSGIFLDNSFFDYREFFRIDLGNGLRFFATSNCLYAFFYKGKYTRFQNYAIKAGGSEFSCHPLSSTRALLLEPSAEAKSFFINHKLFMLGKEMYGIGSSYIVHADLPEQQNIGKTSWDDARIHMYLFTNIRRSYSVQFPKQSVHFLGGHLPRAAEEMQSNSTEIPQSQNCDWRFDNFLNRWRNGCGYHVDDLLPLGTIAGSVLICTCCSSCCCLCCRIKGHNNGVVEGQGVGFNRAAEMVFDDLGAVVGPDGHFIHMGVVAEMGEVVAAENESENESEDDVSVPPNVVVEEQNIQDDHLAISPVADASHRSASEELAPWQEDNRPSTVAAQEENWLMAQSAQQNRGPLAQESWNFEQQTFESLSLEPDLNGDDMEVIGLPSDKFDEAGQNFDIPEEDVPAGHVSDREKTTGIVQAWLDRKEEEEEEEGEENMFDDTVRSSFPLRVVHHFYSSQNLSANFGAAPHLSLPLVPNAPPDRS